MATIDTTVPRTETEFVEDTVNENSLDYADVVAVVGKAKYSAPGVTIIKSGDDVPSILGEYSTEFPATKIVEELFRKREDSDDGSIINGASTVYYVDVATDKEAGEAIIQATVDSTDIDVGKFKFKTAGERAGYTLNITEAGLDYDVVLMNGTEIVDGETYYNVSPAELFNEIKLSSEILDFELAPGYEDPSLIPNLKTGIITFTNGSDGSINTDIKQAIIDAINIIKNDEFDNFVFGLEISQDELYDSEFVKKLIKYFENRQKNGLHTIMYEPNEVVDNSAQSLKTAINRIRLQRKMYCRFVSTNLNTETNNRSMIESTASYCGFVCGTPIKESTGNKVMSDVSSLGVYLEPEQHKTLLKNGITTFARGKATKNEFKVKSAVTGSDKFNPNGSQSALREEHVVRAIFKSLNYFDLNNLVCSTGFDEATQKIKAHLYQQKTELKNAGIIDDVEFNVLRDKDEPRHVIVEYIKWNVGGIVKVITNRVHYNIELT